MSASEVQKAMLYLSITYIYSYVIKSFKLKKIVHEKDITLFNEELKLAV